MEVDLIPVVENVRWPEGVDPEQTWRELFAESCQVPIEQVKIRFGEKAGLKCVFPTITLYPEHEAFRIVEPLRPFVIGGRKIDCELRP